MWQQFQNCHGENSMAASFQIDFVQALCPEFVKKSNSCIRYWQNQNKCCSEIPATRIPFCFLFVPWSQSAKKDSYKNVITVSI
jgi:hypothetical protein